VHRSFYKDNKNKGATKVLQSVQLEAYYFF